MDTNRLLLPGLAAICALIAAAGWLAPMPVEKPQRPPDSTVQPRPTPPFDQRALDFFDPGPRDADWSALAARLERMRPERVAVDAPPEDAVDQPPPEIRVNRPEWRYTGHVTIGDHVMAYIIYGYAPRFVAVGQTIDDPTGERYTISRITTGELAILPEGIDDPQQEIVFERQPASGGVMSRQGAFSASGRFGLDAADDREARNLPDDLDPRSRREIEARRDQLRRLQGEQDQ